MTELCKANPSFEGFQESNTTPVPDILFDALLSELSGAELKVLLYIIRRTRGFKKDTDAISLSQFQKGIVTREGRVLDRGCGISDRQTIVTALQTLEAKSCIECVKAKTMAGDNDVTQYRIYFAKPTGDKGPQGEESNRENQLPPVNGRASQEVVGKSNHPTNRKGSRKIQPQVVGKSNQGSGQTLTRVVGKPNPQETEFQQRVSQQTDDKNEYVDPTSSQAENSFIQSSDTDVSQGGVISPPPGDKGVSSNATADTSRLRIALHTEESPPAIPDIPVSPPQGYKTGNSETPHGDAVMENSTALNETIENLDQLQFWLKKLKIYGSANMTKRRVDMELVLPCVKDKAALESLIARVDAVLFARYGEHKQIFLGNLAEQCEAWYASLSPGQEVYAPSPQGMTLEDRDAFVDMALTCCPDFAIFGTTKAPYFVMIYTAETEYVEFGHSDDWARSNPTEWTWKAAEFGAQYWQQQPLQEAM